MKTDALIVEHTYNVPANKIWSALTDNNEIKKWYFQLKDFKPEVGFKFDFLGGPEEGPHFLHLCEITQLIEERKLAYSWRYDGYPGNSEVCWELFEKADQTRVVITHSGIESFSENGKDFAKDSFKGGWTYFLNDALKNYLEREA
ncbi:SRPBCC family protein [Pedobacter rhodius]|uniref:SRPBCC domain-containing protein n=1 Tax=Pedobacter rhodius TaxID=3004098 RepID=A0ABT4KVA6_9SPHI|nr:SRPBCC domain-containing protein [Pedobacter sp. SJ11]MCZ4222862.1 SRPBCC domain-containing protein [Pedobacter sp. SJ11]